MRQRLRSSSYYYSLAVVCFLLGFLAPRPTGFFPSAISSSSKTTISSSCDTDGNGASRLSPQLSDGQNVNQVYSNNNVLCDARRKWSYGIEPYRFMDEELNAQMGKPRSRGRNATRHPEFNYAYDWSGMQYNHRRFDLMGPVFNNLCPLKRFGAYVNPTSGHEHADQTKSICMTKELNSRGCSVFSIGSNNQWRFELDLAAATPCELYVFDCTLDVKVPAQIASRVKFFKICLGDRTFVDPASQREYRDWKGLHALAGVSSATFMKIDIEGFEWPVLESIVVSAAQHEKETGLDIFPKQIAVEVHYLTQFSILPWHGRDKSPGEIFAFFNFLFFSGHYVIADRRDNDICRHCSEILLSRMSC